MEDLKRLLPMPDAGENDFASGEFLALYSRHAKYVYRFIRTLVSSQQDAEDAFQEVSGILWQKYHQYRPGTNFGAWAIQIARFSVSNTRKRNRRTGPQLSDQVFDAVAEDATEMHDLLEKQHLALADCYRQLSSSERQLVDQRYQGDISVKELARRLNRPLRTVYRLLDRIHSNLLNCIESKVEGDKLS